MTPEEHNELIADIFGGDGDEDDEEDEFEPISHPKAVFGPVVWWDWEA